MIGPDIESKRLSLVEAAANKYIQLQRVFEEWVLAVVQENYGKDDQVIINEVIRGCQNSVDSNLTHHEYMAEVLSENEPVMARQHRLLAEIYRSVLIKSP